MSDKFPAKADVVMALTPSNSVLAQEVARVRGARAIFASKDANGNMILKHNFVIKPGETVLLVDDVTVGGRKVLRAEEMVKAAGAKVLGIAVMVDRSMGILPLELPLRALLSYPIQTFTAKDCPLCASGVPVNEVDDLNKELN